MKFENWCFHLFLDLRMALSLLGFYNNGNIGKQNLKGSDDGA
jgi:hypothetical protein